MQRLRDDAARVRREPPATLQSVVRERIRNVPSPHAGHDIVAGATLRWYRPVTALAASIIVVGATAAWLVMSPSSLEPLNPSGPPGLSGPPVAVNDAGDTSVPDAAGPREPALIEPLRAMIRIDRNDVRSPLADEADRMLSDAAHAARAIIAQLPMRGRSARTID